MLKKYVRPQHRVLRHPKKGLRARGNPFCLSREARARRESARDEPDLAAKRLVMASDGVEARHRQIAAPHTRGGDLAPASYVHSLSSSCLRKAVYFLSGMGSSVPSVMVTRNRLTLRT